MANKIILKRGVKIPTTSNLTSIGEIAYDYKNDKLYVRSSSKVICINPSSSSDTTWSLLKKIDPRITKVME